MCGIVGIASDKLDASSLLLRGLKAFDAHGGLASSMAVASPEGQIRTKSVSAGAVKLGAEIFCRSMRGHVGIGHVSRFDGQNRACSYANAHIAVAVAGNVERLHRGPALPHLRASGFAGETSRLVLHLVTYFIGNGQAPDAAVASAVRCMTGKFALLCLFAGKENMLIAAHGGKSLLVGIGEGLHYVGSDSYMIRSLAPQSVTLHAGDMARITAGGLVTDAAHGNPARRTAIANAPAASAHSTPLRSDIGRQPVILKKTLESYIVKDPSPALRFPALPFDLASLPQMTIIGGGSGYHAGMVGKYWLEKFARLPTSLELTSEFRYHNAPLPPGGVCLFIADQEASQNTLAAVEAARKQGQHVILLRGKAEQGSDNADITLDTQADTSIGAFPAQLAVFCCLMLACAEARNTIAPHKRASIAAALTQLPALAEGMLTQEEAVSAIAPRIAQSSGALFMGRGASHAVALEGAAKLKSMAFMHAEGFAAGELHYGPMGLIQRAVPLIVVAPWDSLFARTQNAMEEAAASGAHIIALCDARGEEALQGLPAYTIRLPEAHPLLMPALCALPLQLLAYHTARLRGHNTAKPRNLIRELQLERYA